MRLASRGESRDQLFAAELFVCDAALLTKFESARLVTRRGRACADVRPAIGRSVEYPEVHEASIIWAD